MGARRIYERACRELTEAFVDSPRHISAESFVSSKSVRHEGGKTEPWFHFEITGWRAIAISRRSKGRTAGNPVARPDRFCEIGR